MRLIRAFSTLYRLRFAGWRVMCDTGANLRSRGPGSLGIPGSRTYLQSCFGVDGKTLEVSI
jgi:hypothetical protein